MVQLFDLVRQIVNRLIRKGPSQKSGQGADEGYGYRSTRTKTGATESKK
jgi:hypothetical protein